MRKWLFILFITFAFVFPLSAYALDVPKSQGYVTDYARMLTQQQKAMLEQKLREFEKSTSNEIAVLIIKSLEGEVLEEYSIKVAQSWGVGKKGLDNGILVLIAKKDRKIRIEIGYGLEGIVPDGAAGYIISEYMTPKFKEDKFYEGISDAVDSLAKATSKEYAEEFKAMMEKKKQMEAKIMLALILTIAGAVITLICSVAHWFAGGMVCGLGAMLTYGVLFSFGPVAWIIIFILGFLLGAVSGIVIKSGGGGDGFFGGFGGGGFGGFGGGSSGGGGASGSW